MRAIGGLTRPRRAGEWLPLLVRGELRLAADAFAVRLGVRPALAGAGADKLALELGEASEDGQHQRPCAVVVSAHASPSDRKPAFFSVIAASVFNRSRVERARRSSRVTITTSPSGDFGEQPAKLGTVNRHAARYFPEHRAGAGGAKLPGLRVNALAAGRDAGITVNRHIGFRDGARPPLGGGRCGERMGLRHGSFMQRTYAARNPLMRHARPSVA